MTAGEVLDRLRREGFRFDGSDGRLLVRPPVGRALGAEEVERLRQHKDALLAILQGAEVEAGPDWRPRLGESWPAVWNDGRCVRCDGQRWRWWQDEARWLCAQCGVTDPDRPMPKPSAPAPEPAGPGPQEDLAGWPPECRESLRLYHRPPVLVTPHARLFPLVGRRVLTPQGPGRLLAARLDGCPVVLDTDPSRAVDIPWQEVRPA